MDTVSELHTEAPQAIASEGLVQGPYVEARAGFEPTTLWTDLPKCHHAPFIQIIITSLLILLASVNPTQVYVAFPNGSINSFVLFSVQETS